eukprot:753612-Hanusia_phi.AAC.3
MPRTLRLPFRLVASAGEFTAGAVNSLVDTSYAYGKKTSSFIFENKISKSISKSISAIENEFAAKTKPYTAKAKPYIQPVVPYIEKARPYVPYGFLAAMIAMAIPVMMVLAFFAFITAPRECNISLNSGIGLDVLWIRHFVHLGPSGVCWNNLCGTFFIKLSDTH